MRISAVTACVSANTTRLSAVTAGMRQPNLEVALLPNNLDDVLRPGVVMGHGSNALFTILLGP